MADLKAARERRGLTREEVSEQTRIPLRFIEAIEDPSARDALPPGPFLERHEERYAAFLGFEEEPDPDITELASRAPEPPPPPEDAPVVRLVLGGFLGAVALVLFVKVGAAALDRPPSEPDPEPLPDLQTVAVRAIEPVHVAVTADGEELYNDTLPPGETHTWTALWRLEVDAADLTRVTIRYNGDRVEPLGRLTQGRRLVFIQEATD